MGFCGGGNVPMGWENCFFKYSDNYKKKVDAKSGPDESSGPDDKNRTDRTVWTMLFYRGFAEKTPGGGVFSRHF